MFHSFFRHARWLLLAASLMGFGGCAAMMDVMPAPPALLAPVKLDGPFDRDIPLLQTDQIKNASVLQDWAVPYIFASVGAHFESAGDPERSIHFFNRAMDEFRKRNNAPGEASAFSRKISALVRFGNGQAAYSAIEALEGKWSRTPLNAFIFFGYGYYYLNNGDHAKARLYFEQALTANGIDSDNPDLLALKRDTEMGYAMALILADYFPAVAGRLGLTDFDAAFYQDIRRSISAAGPHLEKVPALNERIRHTRVYRYFPEMIPLTSECDVLNYLGLSYGIAGKVSAAVLHLEKAGDAARKAGYHLGEADGLFFLNQVYLLDQNHAEGIKAVHALAAVADRYQLMSYAVWAGMMQAHHQLAAGDPGGAMMGLDQALTLLEENHPWLLRDTGFRGITGFKRYALYEALLELNAGKGYVRGTFQAAERSKAAMLVDRLAGEIPDGIPAMQGSIGRVRAFHETLAQDTKRLLSSVSASAVFMDTVNKIAASRSACAELLAGIKEKDEALHGLLSVVPPTISDIQRLMDNNTTLFTFYVGEQYLYIWVINQTGFHQERISLSKSAVERLVNASLGALMSKDKSKADVWAEQVYDAFLKPVIPYVYGDRVGFVPHGALYRLPFAAMRYVQSYLVDGFTIFALPHAGFFKPLPRRKSIPDAKSAIIAADAPCVQKKQPAELAGAEMDALKRLFPQAAYAVRDDSSKGGWQKISGNYEMIHFVLNNCFLMEGAGSDIRPPSETAGRRQGCPGLRDIFQLQLNGGATVFGACRSGVIPRTGGSGIPGLASAWLYAVSPQVVIQLWEVEDKAKAALMSMYYRHFKKDGAAADALRAAQDGMIQLGYGPADWAAFMMIGR
ncbi:MAG: CHAT domain-containing protein [Deltaproteobacteria bacterium]